MKLLDDSILQDGRSLPGGILKVDSFLNHQLDPNLMYEVAREFSRRFDNVSYNKIVTIEASGIAPAIMLGYIRQLPVVFIKKKQPSTMDGMLISEVHSFTKDRTYTVCISRNFLTPSDRVIFIDDFLALRKASRAAATACGRWATTSRASPSSTASTDAASLSGNNNLIRAKASTGRYSRRFWRLSASSLDDGGSSSHG